MWITGQLCTNFFHKSKFISLVSYIFDSLWLKYNLSRGILTRPSSLLNEEPSQLSLKIIQAFKEDVESVGTRFYIVYLPWLLEINFLANGYKSPFSELLEKVEEFALVIHPENGLLNKLKDSTPYSLFTPHYTAEANKIVADNITQFFLRERDSYED